MNFDLSEEQVLLQETVRSFVQKECPMTRVHELFDAEDGYDAALWRRFCELGLAAVAIPGEYGGAGYELLEWALVAEVLGEGAFPGPFLGHSLASLALALGGSDEQKNAWLPKLASGEAVASIAFAEGAETWQPEDWQEPGPDASSRLSTTRRFVPYADQADVFIVGFAGGGLALVPRTASGVESKELAAVDRTRRLGELILSDAPVELLPDGPSAAPRVRDAGLVLLSADALGGAWRCVERAAEYANTREQFGTTIGHFQALKHQLANMAVEVEPSRALYWYAALAYDHIQAESARAAARAKAHIAEVHMQVARDTVEAHGGIGFTWEGDIQIYFKRALFNRAFLGAPAAHLERTATLGEW